MRRRALIFAALLVLVPACTSIGVREQKRPRLFGQWQLSTPQCAALSPRSIQTLRIYDLDHVYDRNPDEAAKLLHEQVIREAHPDTIFTLCEMHYLRGQSLEKKKPLEAIEDNTACFMKKPVTDGLSMKSFQAIKTFILPNLGISNWRSCLAAAS